MGNKIWRKGLKLPVFYPKHLIYLSVCCKNYELVFKKLFRLPEVQCFVHAVLSMYEGIFKFCRVGYLNSLPCLPCYRLVVLVVVIKKKSVPSSHIHTAITPPHLGENLKALTELKGR